MSVILKQFLSKAGYREDLEPEQQGFKEKLTTMNEYRKQNHLCDMILAVGEHEFPAHRAVLSASSKFFEGLFASHMKETTENTVRLQEQQLDPSVVDDVLDFMYTGNVKVTGTNDLAILTAADFLILPVLRERALKSLDLRLNLSTCFSFLMVAEHLNSEDLMHHALNVVKKNLAGLSKNEEFLGLSAGQIDVIFSNEEIQACKQETLYDALSSWAKHDEGREAEFVELFKHIDLKAVAVDYLRSMIATDELIQRNEECAKQVEDVLSIADETENYSPSGNVNAFFVKINENDGLFYLPAEDLWVKKEKLLIPRCLTGENWHESRKIVSHGKHIYLFDPYPIGECKFFSYHIEDNATVQLSPPPYVTPNYTGVVMDDTLYMLGKRGFSRFQRYKIPEKKWDTVLLKEVDRNCQTLVTDGDFLFLVGGTLSSGEASNVVNRYEPRTGTWTTLPPMIESVHSASGFASNGYISVYECDWEIYSPNVNKWFNLSEKGKYFSDQRFKAVRGNIWEVDGIVYLFCMEIEQKSKCCFAFWDIDCSEWKKTSIASIPWDWEDDAGVYCCGPVVLSRKYLHGCEVEEVTSS